MRHKAILLATLGLLALAACSESKVETEKADTGTRVSIDIDGDKAATADAEGAVNIQGDTESGKFEVKLPGGIEANVNVPGGIVDKAKFDIDGVGLYPGAKVGSINVKAHAGKGRDDAVVSIGFTAPADAAAVADWYQQQFEAKKIAIVRNGQSLSGKTEDGDDFTLAMETAAAGGTTGLLTIKDAGNG